MLTCKTSVYTLWRHPQLVPLLHTPDLVLQKLRTGADLMIPGLARGPPFPPKAKLNAIVAIASVEKPSVPRVIGECDIDVVALERVQGIKGIAVRGHHWDGDEIWVWSQSGRTGIDPPDEIEGWDEDAGIGALGTSVENLSMDDCEDEGGVSLKMKDNEESTGISHNPFVDGEDVLLNEQADIEENDMTTKGRSNLGMINSLSRSSRPQKSTKLF